MKCHIEHFRGHQLVSSSLPQSGPSSRDRKLVNPRFNVVSRREQMEETALNFSALSTLPELPRVVHLQCKEDIWHTKSTGPIFNKYNAFITSVDHAEGYECLVVDVIAPQLLGDFENSVRLTKHWQSRPEVRTQVGLWPLSLFGFGPAKVGQFLFLVNHGRVKHDWVSEHVELGPDKKAGGAESVGDRQFINSCLSLVRRWTAGWRGPRPTQSLSSVSCWLHRWQGRWSWPLWLLWSSSWLLRTSLLIRPSSVWSWGRRGWRKTVRILTCVTCAFQKCVAWCFETSKFCSLYLETDLKH